MPLDDALTVVADDFLLPELAPELGPVPEALLEPLVLLATVSCPEISENKNGGETIFIDSAWPGLWWPG